MRLILVILFFTSCVGCISGKGNVRVEYPINSSPIVAGGLDFTFTR